MDDTNRDRLRECRALGTLAGMTSGGVAFGAYFMGQIFEVTQSTPLMEVNILGGTLILAILAAALGGSGLFGRWVGQHIIYPVRVGDDGAATKMLVCLVVAGIAIPLVIIVGLALFSSTAE